MSVTIITDSWSIYDRSRKSEHMVLALSLWRDTQALPCRNLGAAGGSERRSAGRRRASATVSCAAPADLPVGFG
jgi:hypothetical protein